AFGGKQRVIRVGNSAFRELPTAMSGASNMTWCLARIRTSMLIMLGVLIIGLSAGCEMPLPEEESGQRGEGPGHRAQRLGLRPDEELTLGEQAYHEILSQARGRILPGDDPQVRRVRKIASLIVRAAGIRPLQQEINLHLRGYRFEWECNVIRDR